MNCVAENRENSIKKVGCVYLFYTSFLIAYLSHMSRILFYAWKCERSISNVRKGPIAQIFEKIYRLIQTVNFHDQKQKS